MNPETLADEANTEAAGLALLAASVVVSTPAEYEAAGLQLAAAKKALKNVEAMERTVTAPLNAAMKAARELFAPAKLKIHHAIGLFSEPMEAYQLALRKAQREAEEAQKRAEAEALERAHAAKARAAESASPIDRMMAEEEAEEALASLRENAKMELPKAQAKGTASRSSWHVEITDVSLLPREFMVPDEKKLNSIASALKDKAPDIPGVRWVETVKVYGRG